MSPVKLSDVLGSRSAYLLSYMRDDLADTELSTPVSTPAPAAVAQSVGPKRRREDEAAGEGSDPASPSPVKRPAPAALSPVKANGADSALERLLNLGNGEPASPKSPVRKPQPLAQRQLPPSPVSRPSHKLKTKHQNHRANLKQLAVGDRHHHKGAPKSPFVPGSHARSNARTFSMKQREVAFGRNQKRMKGKGGRH